MMLRVQDAILLINSVIFIGFKSIEVVSKLKMVQFLVAKSIVCLGDSC